MGLNRGKIREKIDLVKMLISLQKWRAYFVEGQAFQFPIYIFISFYNFEEGDKQARNDSERLVVGGRTVGEKDLFSEVVYCTCLKICWGFGY